MIKIIQEFVDLGNERHLFHLLDIAKKAAQSNTNELDEDVEETISDKDSKIDEEKIDFNAAEIKDLYVSLIISLNIPTPRFACQSICLSVHTPLNLES